MQRQHGISWRDATRRFKAETERIARPERPEETFPENVTYEAHCGEQCRICACGRRVRLHVNLMAAFASIVRSHGKISQAVSADILLACEVFSGGRHRRQRFTVFAFMTAMSARSGIHPPEQVFITADAVAGQPQAGPDRFAGLDLELCTDPRKPPKKQWLPRQGDPLSSQFSKLRMFNTDQFAKMLLDMNCESDSAPDDVLVTKLLFQDLWPSSVRVTGQDPSIQPVLVSAGEQQGQGAPADEVKVGDGNSDPGEEDVGNILGNDHCDDDDDYDGGSAPVDLLAMLEAEAGEPPPGRKRAKRSTPPQQNDATAAYPVQDGPDGGDDILADPELQAILEADEVEALRQALRECSGANDRSAPPTLATACDSESESVEEEAMTGPSSSQQPGSSQHQGSNEDGYLMEPVTTTTTATTATTPRPMPTPMTTSTSSASSSPSASLAQQRDGRLEPTASQEAAAVPSSSSVAAGGSDSEVVVLRTEADLSQIRVNKMRRGLEVCRVERAEAAPSPNVQILGVVRRMVAARTGHESFQAVCKLHRNCVCWLSSASNLDLLVDWLSSAHQEDAAAHHALAVSLKESLGMRVRK